MTSPDPAAILAQINAAREQTYQNIATAQGILDQANAAASAAAQDRAAIQAIAQQTVRVDTSVGTRVFAGDVMIYGDTGWRDLGANSDASWDFSGHARYGIAIRRTGNRVTLWMAGDYDASTGRNLFNVPLGFRHQVGRFGSAYSQVGVARIGSDLYPIGAFANSRDYYLWGNYPSSGTMVGDFTWTTDEAWPTSLPGTPA